MGSHWRAGGTAYDLAMDERDPGADTAMFRAFVERGNGEEEVAPQATTKTGMWVAIAAAVVVVIVVLLALVLA